jgi:hypothetical protein
MRHLWPCIGRAGRNRLNRAALPIAGGKRLSRLPDARCPRWRTGRKKERQFPAWWPHERRHRCLNTSTRLPVSFAEPIKSRCEAVQLTCRPAKRMSAVRGQNGLSANDALGQFMDLTRFRTVLWRGLPEPRRLGIRAISGSRAAALEYRNRHGFDAAEKVRRPGPGDLARRSHHSNAELDSSGPSSGFSNGARRL